MEIETNNGNMMEIKNKLGMDYVNHFLKLFKW